MRYVAPNEDAFDFPQCDSPKVDERFCLYHRGYVNGVIAGHADGWSDLLDQQREGT